MATAVCETDKEMSELKKKNDSLAKEVERLTTLCNKSERKRRKQKVVYEKNMENLSIRLTDFESNLRREQKEIQEVIAKKDNQIKVGEDLINTLGEKLSQQCCSRCGQAGDIVDCVLENNEDKEGVEVVRKLPPLDLPPPEEKPNISFTNHRPFRPKSKLSPVSEESEISFGSSLRGIHADLTPDRFHAALTASLNLLNDDAEEGEMCANGGAETPSNSVGDLTEVKACDGKQQSSEVDFNRNVEGDDDTVENLTLKENCSIDSTLSKSIDGKKVVSNTLSSFCDKLLADALHLANENMFKSKSSVVERSPTPLICKISPATECLQTFSSDLLQQSFAVALSELTLSLKNEDSNASSEVPGDLESNFKAPIDDRNAKLRTAAAKVADNFFSNNFIAKSLHEEMKLKKPAHHKSTEAVENVKQKIDCEINLSSGEVGKLEDGYRKFSSEDSSKNFVVVGDETLNLEDGYRKYSSEDSSKNFVVIGDETLNPTEEDHKTPLTINGDVNHADLKSSPTTTSLDNSPDTSKSKKKKKKKKKRNRKSLSEEPDALYKEDSHDRKVLDEKVVNSTTDISSAIPEGEVLIASPEIIQTDDLPKQSEEKQTESETTRM